MAAQEWLMVMLHGSQRMYNWAVNNRHPVRCSNISQQPLVPITGTHAQTHCCTTRSVWAHHCPAPHSVWHSSMFGSEDFVSIRQALRCQQKLILITLNFYVVTYPTCGVQISFHLTKACWPLFAPRLRFFLFLHRCADDTSYELPGTIFLFHVTMHTKFISYVCISSALVCLFLTCIWCGCMVHATPSHNAWAAGKVAFDNTPIRARQRHSFYGLVDRKSVV